MFEMFITIVAAIAAALFGLSQTVFMKGPNHRTYQMIAISVIVILFLIYRIHRKIKVSRLRKINCDPDEYYYYDKFTSFLYSCGYFISYLLQNILFDYTYMRRNFNFSKGLSVYEDGVSEYYIRFRNTWYSYFGLLFRRHRVSMRQLVNFSCLKKNQLIVEGLEDPADKAMYTAFQDKATAFAREHHFINDMVLRSLGNYNDIYFMFRENVLKLLLADIYVEKNQPKIIRFINIQEARGRQDIDDYKKLKMHRR